MENKEKKLLDELQKCKENIQRTRERIAYHRDILRKQERKANEIAGKLDKEKMRSLYTELHARGVDIDSLRQAVANGEIAEQTAKPAEAKKEEENAQTDSL